MTGTGRDGRRAVGGVLVLTVVILGALAWAVVVQSPLFDVRRIEVRGSGRLAPGDVTGLLEGFE